MKMLSLIIIILSILMSGCGPGRVVVKTEKIEVVKYVREPLPSNLFNPIITHEPPPLCFDIDLNEKVFCNGQLGLIINLYRSALFSANEDRAAVANAQPSTQIKIIENKIGDSDKPSAPALAPEKRFGIFTKRESKKVE